ncbi:MAG: RNB domain-containing ribonuclease [Acidimicrobiales bacterium]
MPTPQVTVADAAQATEVVEGMARVRSDLGVADGFPADVLAAADAAARAATRPSGRPDRTDIALVTIDPPGSRDLDQAYGAERRPGGGYRIWYAIADVDAFVEPGDAVDAECHGRGVTLYGPDRREPLHPPVLGEGAASLLPDGDRPALLWCIDLDVGGAPVATRLERAVVRSRAQLTYDDVVADLASGSPADALVLLREVGVLRQAAEAARGGVSLPLPDQVVEPDGHDHYRLAYRAPVESEGWNAQISLLAGLEAARIMMEGGVGLLRMLAPPDDGTLARLRHSARALGVDWPPTGGYPAFVRSLDPASPAGAALLVQATRALRGAGYVGFVGGVVPDDPVHGAVAAPYAHVTAPLRRLCDRAANEMVVSLLAGDTAPEWAVAELAVLPEVMAQAGSREGAFSRAALDLVEALVLAPAVGERFAATVVDVDQDKAQVQLRDPAVVARARNARACEPGDEVEVVLRAADPLTRRVDLEVV